MSQYQSFAPATLMWPFLAATCSGSGTGVSNSAMGMLSCAETAMVPSITTVTPIVINIGCRGWKTLLIVLSSYVVFIERVTHSLDLYEEATRMDRERSSCRSSTGERWRCRRLTVGKTRCGVKNLM